MAETVIFDGPVLMLGRIGTGFCLGNFVQWSLTKARFGEVFFSNQAGVSIRFFEELLLEFFEVIRVFLLVRRARVKMLEKRGLLRRDFEVFRPLTR